jgi:AsmA protein
MKKPVKITIIVAGVLLAIIVALVLILPSLINLDRVRSLAEEKATATLGRAVVIDGVGFSLWKGPRVSLNGLRIAEAKAFGGEPFVELGSFDLKVRFWPLLKKRAEVDHVILVDPRIRIVRNSKQVWNYQDILDHMESAPVEKEPRSGTTRTFLITWKVRQLKRSRYRLVVPSLVHRCPFWPGTSGLRGVRSL